MLRILGFALCASCAAAMHAPAARPPAVLASRVLAAVRMSSPLPPPPPDSLGLGGSTAGVGGSTAGTAGASPSAKSSEDDAFSMFGDGDDELAIAKESLINELGDGLQALGDNQASRKVCAARRAAGARPSARARARARARDSDEARRLARVSRQSLLSRARTSRALGRPGADRRASAPAREAQSDRGARDLSAAQRQVEVPLRGRANAGDGLARCAPPPRRRRAQIALGRDAARRWRDDAHDHAQPAARRGVPQGACALAREHDQAFHDA